MTYSKAFLFSVMILAGCHSDKPKVANIEPAKPFKTHAVHNVCADLWAVRTWDKIQDNEIIPGGPQEQHTDHYWGKVFFSGTYFGEKPPPDRDSADDAYLGSEYQFKDSATAMRVYNDYCYRRDRPQQIADSIFKCKHTYQ